MARVYHLADTAATEPEKQRGAKTLCGRDATHRYRFTTADMIRDGSQWNEFNKVCDRCLRKAEKLGLIRPMGINIDGSINYLEISSGDKDTDDWLSRLGVC